MKEQERAELTALKQRQTLLALELRGLSKDLRKLEQRLQAGDDRTSAVHEDKNVTQVPPLMAPPPLPGSLKSPPILPVLPFQPAEAPQPTAITEAFNPNNFEESQSLEPLLKPVAIPPTANRGSLELRLGTYWAPRIGIVVLLTGLVFLGNLAYQNLGRTGKIMLLYLASAILLGTGWWWQRKEVKNALRNYAQVLFAGGLAALYFTTYAAHHLDTLKIIPSAAVDGALLLACAGLIVWTADHWKSEVLALFGAGLAYYTCIITRVGSFTLYSNLLLTIAAVFFLVRNRWATLTFGSVVASYGAYAFWRFFNGSEWHWSSPAEGLWSGTYFLVAYWTVFTTGVFLTRDDRFEGQNRAAFLTLNNGAFLTGFILTLIQVGHTAAFWQFALIYGAVLLALSEVARKVLPSEPLARDFYLSQGLLLVTIGFISKFAGLNLALILAAESVLLLLMAQARKSMIFLVAAYVASGLAVGWAIDGMRQNEPPGVYLAAGIAGLMLANTLLVQRKSPSTAGPLLRADRAYFAVLALTTVLVTTHNNASREFFPLMLAAEGVVFTFSIYLLRVREVTLLSQGFLLISQIAWCLVWLERRDAIPWWNPSFLLVINLLVGHWWQRQKTIELPRGVSLLWQQFYALAIVGVLTYWLRPKFQGPAWMVMTSAMAIGITAYGVITRAWLVSAAAQIFVAISAGQFALQLWEKPPAWTQAAVPVAALLTLSWATVIWFWRLPDPKSQVRQTLLSLALGYRWVAIAMSIAWINEFIPAKQQIWVSTAIGAALFGWAGGKRNREALAACAVYASLASLLFWNPAPGRQPIYWANLLALGAILAQQQIARRFPLRYPLDATVHPLVIVAGTLSISRFCTLWIIDEAGGFYLTAGWSFLALIFFACGILLRERTYRWLGLALLGCALGRIVVFDVWKLQTLYRILSFIALGVVLLVLGYIYSKYQEKIKEWL